VPVKVADVPMKAKRPQYCALSNRKLADAGIAMPPWQDALRRYLEVVQARNAANAR
jgi:dTDP-4-dehydrorhamnose reductase